MRIAVAGMMLAGLTSMAVAQETNVTISVAGVPALSLSMPAGAKVFPIPQKTTIVTTNMYLHIWSVSDAGTTTDALPRVATVIKSDVLEFKPGQTNAITVAGAPAVHLIGPGKEADDGDAGMADVVVFAVGKRVFVACVHGEGNDASLERKPMLDALKTAKAP